MPCCPERDPRLRGRKSTGHKEDPQGNRSLTLYGMSRAAVKKWYLFLVDKATEAELQFDWEGVEPSFFEGEEAQDASAGSRQHAAGGRQEAASSRQQAADNKRVPACLAACPQLAWRLVPGDAIHAAEADRRGTDRASQDGGVADTKGWEQIGVIAYML